MSDAAGARLLLCRPLGGLNDILCQIERCCAYADRFGRTVVVDTEEQSDFYIRDRFSRYFHSLRDNLILDFASVSDRVDVLDVMPAFLTGRVRASRPRYSLELATFVDETTGLPVTFDFARDHPASLLVHHQAGGGVESLGALARLRLTDALITELRSRLAAAGPGYLGLHIRDTDYRTRYQALLERAAIAPDQRIFVATDSAAAVAHCRALFGADRVLSFAVLPADRRRLHYIDDPARAFERNRDAILDLLMLALASGFHMFQIEPNPYGLRFSGYSVLAANLRSRPDIIAQLLDVPDLAALWPAPR